MEYNYLFYTGILFALSLSICQGGISLPVSGVLKSGRSPMLPGATYKMGCEVSGDLSPGDILMLTRHNTTVRERKGYSGVITERIFVENGEFGPHVNISDRYTVMDYVNDQETMIKFDVEITDAKPEDSGYFICQVNTSSHDLLESARPTEIIVIGPILSMSLFASPNDSVSNEAKVETGGEVTLMENDRDYLFYSKLEYENFLPNYSIYLQHEEGGKTYTKDVDLDPLAPTYSHATIHENGLVSYFHSEWITLRDTKLSFYQSNRKSLYAVAYFPPVEGIPTQPNLTTHFVLNILFEPKDVYCKDESASPGDNDVTVMCTVLANPRPNITWDIDTTSDKNATKPSLTTKEEYDGNKLTVAFKFPKIEESHYVHYKVSAKNEYGETTGLFKLQDVRSSSSIKQGSFLLLLLCSCLALSSSCIFKF